MGFIKGTHVFRFEVERAVHRDVGHTKKVVIPRVRECSVGEGSGLSEGIRHRDRTSILDVGVLKVVRGETTGDRVTREDPDRI